MLKSILQHTDVRLVCPTLAGSCTGIYTAVKRGFLSFKPTPALTGERNIRKSFLNSTVVPKLPFLCKKIFSFAVHFFKQKCLSDTNGNLSSTRIAMLVIVLWFLADFYLWLRLLEFHFYLSVGRPKASTH